MCDYIVLDAMKFRNTLLEINGIEYPVEIFLCTVFDEIVWCESPAWRAHSETKTMPTVSRWIMY